MGEGDNKNLWKKATKYVDRMLLRPDSFWYQHYVIKEGKSRLGLIEMELAGERFWQACHNSGAYGHYDIVKLLQSGGIPAKIIEAVLLQGYDLGGDDYPAIAQGYEGKLSPNAREILYRRVPECKQLRDAIDYLLQLGEQDPNKTMSDLSWDEWLKLLGKLHGVDL